MKMIVFLIIYKYAKNLNYNAFCVMGIVVIKTIRPSRNIYSVLNWVALDIVLIIIFKIKLRNMMVKYSQFTQHVCLEGLNLVLEWNLSLK